MTYPTEAQLIEMEQRARSLLDGITLRSSQAERMEQSGGDRALMNSTWEAIERDEDIAGDVLTLVALVRAGARKAAA
jgi:hypothetical protein